MLLATGAAPTDGVDASCADAAVFVTSLNGVVAAKKVRTSAVPAAPALALFFRGIVCGARKREVIFFGFSYFTTLVFFVPRFFSGKQVSIKRHRECP